MFVVDYVFNGFTDVQAGYNTMGAYLLDTNGKHPPTPISDFFTYQNAIYYIASDGLLYRIDNISISHKTMRMLRPLRPWICISIWPRACRTGWRLRSPEAVCFVSFSTI